MPLPGNKLPTPVQIRTVDLDEAPLTPAQYRASNGINQEISQEELDEADLSHITPALRHLAVPIDSLTPDPLNARLHPEDNLEAIKESLQKYGQLKPVVVRRSNRVIVAGNGTTRASRELGYKWIAATFVDLDDVAAAGYGLADNRTAELAKWDTEVVTRLDALLRMSNETPIGWTDRQLQTLRMQLEDAQQVEIFGVDQIVEACFNHFRKTGFPYPVMPVHSCMQEINSLANSDPTVLAETTTGIAVADSYHKHRWHAPTEEKLAPYDTYIDDDRFRTAIRVTLEVSGKVGKTFVEGLRYSRNTQACANFRPGYALLVYKRFAPKDAVVLDTSTGYGGRLIGFMASGLKRYIGIDPNTETCAANKKMAGDLGFGDRVTIIQKPAEDVAPQMLAGKCDIAFTSPPYFRKEHYSDEPTQSWKRYPTGDAWRDGFLRPMLRLQYAALKKGCRSIINIADVEMKGKRYPLVQWTIDAAEAAGFVLESSDNYPLNRVPGEKGAETSSEPVLVFVKE